MHEILRCFYRLIQLSPFLFEDFCSALRSVNQSNLLAEIHIALIRLLLRDDEEEQTIFVTPDTNASFNALIQFLEPMTYAEVIMYSFILCQNRNQDFGLGGARGKVGKLIRINSIS